MVRTSPSGFSTSNTGRIARAIYLQSVLPTLTPEDYGKYLCIDCDTGKWELAEGEFDASMRIWRANPTGRNRVGVRIGYTDQDAAGSDDNENVFLPPLVEKSPGEVSPGEIAYRERWYELARREPFRDKRTPSSMIGREAVAPNLADLLRVAGKQKAEIVDGKVVLMSPTGIVPGRAGGRIYRSLTEYEDGFGGGYAVPDNVGFSVDLPNRKSSSPAAAFYYGRTAR